MAHALPCCSRYRLWPERPSGLVPLFLFLVLLWRQFRMDGKALLTFVDLMQRDKNISRETVFGIIEQAVRLATEKYFGEKGTSEDITVSIDRANGAITARRGETDIDPGVLGRNAAQAAKQSMIQKFREVECDAVCTEYTAKKGDLVKATVTR